MEELVFRIFVKQDDNIFICKMKLDSNSILKIRDNFYNSYKEIVKTEEVVKGLNFEVPLYDGGTQTVPVLYKLTKDIKDNKDTTFKDYLKIVNREELAQYKIDYCKPNALIESFAFPVVNAELSKYNTIDKSINKEMYQDLFYQNGHFDTLKFFNKERFFYYANIKDDCLVFDDILQSTFIYTMWLNYVLTYQPQNKLEEILKDALSECITIYKGSCLKKENIINRLITSNKEYFIDKNKNSGIIKSKFLKRVLKQEEDVLDENKVNKFNEDFLNYIIDDKKIEKNIKPLDIRLDIL